MPSTQLSSTFFIKIFTIVRQGFSQISALAWLVILTGLALRLWVGLHTVIINPDGALYVHQAMALHCKDWGSLKTCGLSFISIYPILIAAGYHLTHDWILSARLISLFFGTALLIPLYLMLKEWDREDSAILGLLVFAVTPMLVSNSVELVRDPISWFFLCAGTFVVIRHANTHSPWLLLVASLCFLAAIWARIEDVLFPAITLGYLLCFQKNRRMINILFFLSPFLMIAIFSIAGMMFSGLAFNDLHRGNEIAGQFIGPIRQYQKMAESLKNLVWTSPNPFMNFFLPEARNLIWLIALGTLLNRFLEAFFYPFVLFYLIGISGIHRHRSDSRLLYLSFLTASGLLLLYMHTLQTWLLYYRFFGIVMIPSAIFCAFGLEKLLEILPRRLSVKKTTVFWAIFLLILGISLPKNLKSPDPDKPVFIQIAETVSQNAPESSGIRIATSCHTQTWISFYANIHLPGVAPCPLDRTNCWEAFPDDPDQFYDHLRQNRLSFVLWEEKHWPFSFTLSDPEICKRYKEIGRWYHKDTGTMILYAVSLTTDGR